MCVAPSQNEPSVGTDSMTNSPSLSLGSSRAVFLGREETEVERSRS
jgi:hypothetical protein